VTSTNAFERFMQSGMRLITPIRLSKSRFVSFPAAMLFALEARDPSSAGGRIFEHPANLLLPRRQQRGREREALPLVSCSSAAIKWALVRSRWHPLLVATARIERKPKNPAEIGA
jgi:hypothetical protein